MNFQVMNDSLFLLEDNHQKLIGIGVDTSIQGTLEACSAFVKLQKGEHLFCMLSYDLKNQIESLSSSHDARVEFPELFCCVPSCVVSIKDGQINYLKGEENDRTKEIVAKFNGDLSSNNQQDIQLTPSLTKEEYLDRVKRLQEHIQYGDIYEVTFCQEFYAENASINPFLVYQRLSNLTQTPFRCFVKHGDAYLMSGSPERFIRKKGNTISSQPIKGTAKRSEDAQLDEALKNELRNSTKEKAENVMIVDLVRNDLSRIAQRDSVKVDELFGLYSFRTVHQLISTISAEVDAEIEFKEIMRALFPMGSMTGAPKISAMKLIEKYENFRRGMFSGSVGYISPNGDFDFNVIIRSILYDQAKRVVSCPVGGAITIQSDPESEYEECLLKVDALQKALLSK
jgi:para-aminobenzoate synthetase component 1